MSKNCHWRFNKDCQSCLNFSIGIQVEMLLAKCRGLGLI